MIESSYIIVGGKRVPCAAPVRLHVDHGMQFEKLKARKRTSVVTLHWTGAENPPERVFRNMTVARKSVHFVVGAGGEAYQFCDADMLCAHASGQNERAVGIEVVNRANGAKTVPRGPDRTLLKETVHGKEFVYTAFLPAQVHTVQCIVAALCEAYKLPMAVPMENVTRTFKRGSPALDHEPVRRVIPRQLTDAEFDNFRGVTAHFHRTKTMKRDCGIALLQAIAAFDVRALQGLSGPAE